MGLVSGLAYPEIMDMPPGLVIDLFIMRREYDDQQHRIERNKKPLCED